MFEGNWEVEVTEEFEEWFLELPLEKAKAIAETISVGVKSHGRFPGRSKSVGDNLYEFREMHYGLRAYYFFKGQQLILVLGGGDKKTQKRDIKAMKQVMKEYSDA